VHILVRATRRTNWFAGRLALCAAAILVAGALAGLGAWLGAKSQGVDFPIRTLLGAGLNVVPTALVALGIGAVVLSLAPRAAAVTVYVAIVGSLVIDLFGSLVSSVSWLRYVSLFHYMALAPAQDASPMPLALNTAVGITLAIAGTVLFRNRDLQTA
jgi:ABC-2 type transport system permease protein